jgi:hypothetical protein
MLNVVASHLKLRRAAHDSILLPFPHISLDFIARYSGVLETTDYISLMYIEFEEIDFALKRNPELDPVENVLGLYPYYEKPQSKDNDG